MGIIKKIILLIIVFFVISYVCILTILPYFINKTNYSHILSTMVKQSTGLILVLHNYNVDVSPSLNVSLKVEEIQLFYPNKKQILNIKNANVSVSPLSLLKRELKVNKIKADEIQFVTKILKNGVSTFQAYLDERVSEKNDKMQLRLATAYPDIDVKEYIFKITDEKTNQKLKLKGKTLKIKQNIHPQYFDILINGDFFSNQKRYVNYTVKATVPKSLLMKTDLFHLRVNDISTYDFFAVLNSDIKLTEKNSKIETVDGYINIDKFTMKLGNKNLPESYFHVLFSKGKAKLTSMFYTNIDEKANITANFKVKKPFDLNIKCYYPKANISNLQQLAINVLDILKIKNNLREYKIDGQLSADFSVWTNLKTVKSSGDLSLVNASITHKTIPLVINNINALLDFTNNTVNVKKSTMSVNNQPVQLVGKIDGNAFVNMELFAKNLDLNHILNSFPFLKLDKNLHITSGKLTFNTKLYGKLETLKPIINAKITEFSFVELSHNVKAKIQEVLLDAKTEKGKYSGKLTLHSVSLIQSTTKTLSNNLSSDVISMTFDNGLIKILSSRINMGKAKLILDGEIKDYAKKVKSKISLKGNVDAVHLKSIADSFGIKLFAKGYLPLNIEFTQNGTQNFVDVQLLANNNNYITPVHINNLKNVNSLTHISAQILADGLNVSDFCVYYSPALDNLNQKQQVTKLKKIITLKGLFDKVAQKDAILNNVNIKTHEPLSIVVPDIPNSSMEITSDLSLQGKLSNLCVLGSIQISNLKLPPYFLSLRNCDFIFNKNQVFASLNNLKYKANDFNIDISTTTDFLKLNKISNIKINSPYIDINEMIQTLDFLPQSNEFAGYVLPYIVEAGKINIQKAKIENLIVENITADTTLNNSVINIDNINAKTYGGNISGTIKYDSRFSTIDSDLKGRRLSAENLAKVLQPQEQNVYGILNFDSKIKLYGNNVEQFIKTANGVVNIQIVNGHLGKLGRFEHFLYAQNLLSQKLINTNLDSAKQAIIPKDTGRITELKGTVKIKNGVAIVNPIYTTGPNMSMFVNGNVNLLTERVDLEILGKISSEVSNSMGSFGQITLNDLIQEHTNLGNNDTNSFKSYHTELPEMDISKIPPLSSNSVVDPKNFRVLIQGNPNSIKSVKSFTWVNPLGTSKNVTKNQTNSDIRPNNQLSDKDNENESSVPEFLDSIPDHFH